MEEVLFCVCPYNSEHRVPVMRIQQHLVKCQKNYPSYEICPYNATHRYPPELIKDHVKNCPAKEKIFPENKPPSATATLTKPKPICQKDYLPETDPNHEMWDDL